MSLRTFDGQNHWIIIGTEGGVSTGWTVSEPLNQQLQVISIDWDEFSSKNLTAEELQENLNDMLPRLRDVVPPGRQRKLFRHSLVTDYRFYRPLGTQWWDNA